MSATVRIIEGDCLSVLPSIESGSIDAVITDPPYGTKKTPWDHSIDRRVIAECLRVSRGYSLFCYSNTRLWHILGIIHDFGYDSWVVAWHKPNAMGFERRFAPQWVPVVCAYRGNLPFWGKDLVAVPIVPHRFDHPTPKPLDLMRWLVRKACPEGGTILDPFAGSGTTGLAALLEGRNAVLIERESAYCGIIRRRLADESPLFAEAAS